MSKHCRILRWTVVVLIHLPGIVVFRGCCSLIYIFIHKHLWLCKKVGNVCRKHILNVERQQGSSYQWWGTFPSVWLCKEAKLFNPGQPHEHPLHFEGVTVFLRQNNKRKKGNNHLSSYVCLIWASLGLNNSYKLYQTWYPVTIYCIDPGMRKAKLNVVKFELWV